mmetsp:Transcript_49926/g.128470  ORF Transcript_49926/g.128470 Transcript_49926/m.128470 type:complete len:436 (-) Transcript_49926:137-1444(-)
MRASIVIVMMAISVLACTSALSSPYGFLKKFGIGGEKPDIDSFVSELRASAEGAAVKPVVLIPPLTGTQLFLKIDKPHHDPHFYCLKKLDWHRAWVNELEEAPLVIGCSMYNLALTFNNDTGSYESPEGVFVKPGEGIEAVEYLDPSSKKKSGTVVYGYIVELLQSVYGYEVGKNLVAHPYDWRYGPSAYFGENGTFAVLKKLIEDTVEANNGVKAVLPAISMGSPYANLFLTDYVTDEWKAKYVDTFFSISGVFGGSPVALRHMIAPDDWDGILPKYAEKDFRDFTRSTPSIAWVTPFDVAFGNEILVETPTRNYTVSEQADAMRAAGGDNAADNMIRERKYLPFKDPGVHVECIYGHGVDTVGKIIFKDSPLKQDQPEFDYVSGDGTVPVSSLKICEGWADVTSTSVPNAEHTDLINTPITYQTLLKAVLVDN